MPASEGAKKTYVRPDNTAVLTCVHCGRQKVILADSFKGYKHKIKVKCICNRVFTVNLEFRTRVRKKTHLRGTYINYSQNDSNGDLVIQDISVTGLSFTCSDVNKFKVGDELRLEFTLDDEHRTEIKKDVVVLDVRRRSVGCKYESAEDALGSPLGYYVTQNF
ncbi:MAG: hypothetical protein AMJ61_16295 [Desulfobacterales bacterium SG8_35_2]|nr:MAG: hypothetical protein AMJ61_16295 [Desulfobacterales bacterium SG8_35_2]